MSTKSQEEKHSKEVKAMIAAMSEQDVYAEQVTAILTEQGLVADEEEVKRYLRGW